MGDPDAAMLDARDGAFIASCNNLSNSLGDDEAVLFMDAVHPKANAKRSSGSARGRTDIRGALDLETGQTGASLVCTAMV